MASNNIARLGVVLGLDTAEFTASIDKAISENTKLKRAIQRDSNAAAKEIVALKYATDDYGKTLSKVEAVEREMASGRYKNASVELQQTFSQSITPLKITERPSVASRRSKERSLQESTVQRRLSSARPFYTPLLPMMLLLAR